jgi:hypothetical protein
MGGVVPIQFRVDDHLIVPFACPKWEIEDIRIKGVSTDATFFEADSPVAYINRAVVRPLSLTHVKDVWPLGNWDALQTDDWSEALSNILSTVIEFGNLQTQSERRFIEAYFRYLTHAASEAEKDESYGYFTSKFPDADPDWVFYALLPLPQAHLYVVDPLEDFHSIRSPVPPKNMFKVDFAFWTGEQFVAVEIDGGSHIGSDKHIRKDRMLQRAGVQVVHILNSEVEKMPEKVIRRLLPGDVAHFWKHFNKEKRLLLNPLAILPF